MDIGWQLFPAKLHSTYPAALWTISTIFASDFVSGICFAGNTRIRRQIEFSAAARLAGGAPKTRLAFLPAVYSARRWRRGRKEPKKGFESPSLQAGATCSDRPIRRRHMASPRIIPFLCQVLATTLGEKEGKRADEGPAWCLLSPRVGRSLI
jgi:hypothetical protein